MNELDKLIATIIGECKMDYSEIKEHAPETIEYIKEEILKWHDKNKYMIELEKWIIDELPSNGEWWSSGYETFIERAKDMLNRGYEIEEIKEILSSLYSAVASEFGN